MLCPSCLTKINEFSKEIKLNKRVIHKCPSCNEFVPYRYIHDYLDYPPVSFFFLALPGHGKTAYAASLFCTLEHVGRNWENFNYSPSGEKWISIVREKQRDLENNIIPVSETNLFVKPAFLRLENVPDMGNCHLLMYDAHLKDRPNLTEEKFYSGYLINSEAVAFLVSLEDLKSPSDLTDILTWYLEELVKYNRSSEKQSLILLLTKSDILRGPNELPAEIQEFLEIDSCTDLEIIEKNSKLIQTWMENHKGFVNFARLAQREFKSVSYSIVTSIGKAPNEKNEMELFRPQGIIPSLINIWQSQKSAIESEIKNQKKQNLIRPVKEVVENTTRGILGGIWGMFEGAVWGAFLWAFVMLVDCIVRVSPFDKAIIEILKFASWGALWGIVIWFTAGIIEVLKGQGNSIRKGVRIGAVYGLLINAFIAAVTWGLIGIIVHLLKFGYGQMSQTGITLISNSINAALAGAKVGAILGALWGLVVSLELHSQIKKPSGPILSLTLSGIISGLLSAFFTEMSSLLVNIIWMESCAIIYALWALQDQLMRRT